jgi:hypothetical protein
MEKVQKPSNSDCDTCSVIKFEIIEQYPIYINNKNNEICRTLKNAFRKPFPHMALLVSSFRMSKDVIIMFVQTAFWSNIISTYLGSASSCFSGLETRFWGIFLTSKSCQCIKVGLIKYVVQCPFSDFAPHVYSRACVRVWMSLVNMGLFKIDFPA